MQNWKKTRNFRKQESADGSFTYTITVDDETLEVSEEIFTAYAQGGYKMEHMEFSIKSSRFLQNSEGKAVRDENGSPVMLPEREVSLDKLIDEDWECPSLGPSPEGVVLKSLEISSLRNALVLLDADERELINALFFEGVSIRVYAEYTGQSKSKIDRQKNKILGKLKKIMGN